MPRRIRIQDPEMVFFVTNTCIRREFLFVPGSDMNDRFRARLRQAVRIFKVELYAAVCMGNHFHLVVRCPLMNLDSFMCYFQSLLARDVMKLRGITDSVVFPTRYDAEPILDEAALEEKLAYTVLNPVRAGIVSHPGEYPGYTSWGEMFEMVEGTQVEVSEKPPQVVAPPMWTDLSADEIRERWEAIVEDPLESIGESFRYFLGAERALKLKHWAKPRGRREKRRDARGRVRKPRAHASCLKLWQAYVKFADSIATEYRESVGALREGEFVEFPYGTRPPGWARCECESKRNTPRHCLIRSALPAAA